MKIDKMTFYFDLNHPTKLLTALSLVYSLDKQNNKRFKHYTSSEYDKVEPGSVFFFVDEQKHGLEINTRRMAMEGYTVFALKFPPAEGYVSIEIAEAVIKMWSRVLKHIQEPNETKIYKYHYKSDILKPCYLKI